MKERSLIAIILFMFLASIAIDFASYMISMIIDGLFVCAAMGAGVMLLSKKNREISSLKKEIAVLSKLKIKN